MPNWCATTYWIHFGDDEETAHKVYDALQAVKEQDCLSDFGVSSDFGNWGLPNLIAFLGLNPIGYECRGWIDWVDFGDYGNSKPGSTTLRVDVETAWSPKDDAILLLMNTLAPEYVGGITYMSDEPGMGYNTTNIPKEDLDPEDIEYGYDYADISLSALNPAPVIPKDAPVNRFLAARDAKELGE